MKTSGPQNPRCGLRQTRRGGRSCRLGGGGRKVYRFAGRTNDPNTTLTGLPATGTLDVICEAVNEAGPGVASAMTSLVLG